MKQVRVDCTNFQSADDGSRCHYGGEIVITDLETDQVKKIDCSEGNSNVDDPGTEVLEYWPTLFGLDEDDIFEYELQDIIMDHGEFTDVPGQVTIIEAEKFEGDPSSIDDVYAWIRTAKFEKQSNDFTSDELKLISLGLSTLGPDYESVLKKINDMIEK